MKFKILNKKFYKLFNLINISLVILVLLVPKLVKCQLINRVPHFIPGTGDMSKFSLSENTPIGTPVYQLRGIDPEGGSLRYSISGPVFSVDRDTGVVRLRQELDRETQSAIEVIISITDEGVLGTEPNTISLRREIPVRDYNDNPPMFIGRPYSTSVSESTNIGSFVEIDKKIIVIDRDEGKNSEVTVTCIPDRNSDNDDICDVFEILNEKISDGKYEVKLKIRKSLDFETRPSYILHLRATDGAVSNKLSAEATVSIGVNDVQDQAPVFQNTPYSTNVAENSPEDSSVLTITATDGDTGNPRPILLTLENEKYGYFKLQQIGSPEEGRAILLTTNNLIDRENPEILQNGGVYTFDVRATELINNEVPADSSISQITIVITDVDDHIPTFNKPEFNISLPENLEQDTPLPGLSVFVVDEDLGANSRYNLTLRNVKNSENVFAVTPTFGEGRTPIVVKIINSKVLDYDVEDEDQRIFIFDLFASVNGKDLAKTRITVNLQDANDNPPIFEKNFYTIEVEENKKIGYKITDLTATDKDSNIYGKIKYALKGFGAEFFSTDENNGGIYVRQNLNYENQKSYSLTLVATDGGGRESNANLLINILDVNDNNPRFDTLEYTRTIREGATEFEPQFFVRAVDEDGPTQGGGKVTYRIESENSISGHVFSIDSETGEIKMTAPVSSMDTERGQYELIVSATDHGIPPLKNDTRVLIRVGISGNQRPIFKGNFFNTQNSIPGPPTYRVNVPENALPGYNVTTISASDPDGLDSLLQYRIVGAGDNFIINDKSGLIQVSTDSRLDRDTNPHQYSIIVNAVDAGFPIPETATATVYVNIQDVNDKPPKFSSQSYTAYVSERAKIGSNVLQVTATDTDLNSKIVYSITEPIKAISKTGVQIPENSFDFKSSFIINNTTGEILVNKTLDYNSFSVMTLTVKAIDLNAEINKEKQFAIAEVTLFIQSFKDTNPVFKHRGWTSISPYVKIKVKEELPIGIPIFKLKAEDPVLEETINKFELLVPDSNEQFDINPDNGEIILKKRLDYESLNSTFFLFTVKAISSDQTRISTAIVNVSVENVNDNDPIFDKDSYHVTVMESYKYPMKILQVHATDADANLNENDEKIGYHIIKYSLTGQYAGLFSIDNTTGQIFIGKNQILDREKQSVLKLVVIAEDSPGKPTESRKTAADIVIDVLDVNDNAPQFLLKTYTAVIPENAPINTFVINMTAIDPDEGPGGEVTYDILNEGEANGLLMINSMTGEILTKTQLTGKGRSEPYELVIRAQDNGNLVPKQESLYSDISLTLYIGDVSSNDGIPFFIAPKIGQIANISENATIGSAVFQIIASDPDNPATPSGQLSYRIQKDIDDAKAFKIDSISGLVTTTKSLDREVKSTYNIIVEVSDHGNPPQVATTVLNINVLDIDDHKPRFIRDVESPPFEVMVLEEQEIGTVITNISAIDEDIDENGAIDYMFIDGNELGIFNITRTEDNQAIISSIKRIDREKSESYILTIKCFKYKTKHNLIARKSYNPYDLSELQILIKVIDIDDHLPEFEIKDQTVGVRLNIPVDTHIVTVKAIDDDPDALKIDYSLKNVTFVPQYYVRDRSKFSKNLTDLFSLNRETGELKTIKYLSSFVDGYFELIIKANNSDKENRFKENTIKIYVIRDKSLLRFVFAKPASELNSVIDDFKNKIQSELKSTDLELHVFDTQVLMKADHSLDFSSSSSCFQLSRHGTVLSPHETQKIMDSNEIKNILTETYIKYSVNQVDSCSVKRRLAKASLITSAGTWLVILATFIGIATFIATITACCFRRKFNKQMQSNKHVRPVEPAFSTATPVIYAEPIYGQL